MSIILVHGSVETSLGKKYIDGLKNAARKGGESLSTDNNRLLAIESVVNELEDNPLYNAGLGSVLNRDGYIEVDGSLMDGSTGRFASVAAMKGVRNAISVAKKVMEETSHIVLAGEGATIFAREHGFPYDNCITDVQLKSWQAANELVKEGKPLTFSPYTGIPNGTDTVGCVMMDDHGNLAAGSSTGGSFFKLPGRVGDTPFIGGGIYATKSCAVVCTGRGEAFIQTLTASFIDSKIREGIPLEKVAKLAIQRLYQLTGETGGVIVIDHSGKYAAAHNSDKFPVVAMIDGNVKKLDPIVGDNNMYEIDYK